MSDDIGNETTDETTAAIRIVRGTPTTTEIAAVTAVVSAAREELAAETARHATPGQSAWQRSQRTVREPIQAGPGQWRSFSA